LEEAAYRAGADDRPMTASAAFAEQLVGLLPTAPTYWRWFEHYFRVLACYAGQGPWQALHLVRESVIPRLVDLYLGDDSPLAEANPFGVVTGPKGRRNRMRGKWNTPDLSSWLKLLRVCVCRCELDWANKSKPPTYPSPGADVAAVKLSDTGRQVLLCKAFLSRLLLEATTRRKGGFVGDIIVHLCWEQEQLSQTVAGLLMAGIEENNSDVIRPYFRTIHAFFRMQDSLAAKRQDWLLSSLLSVMKLQQQYWKITELCAEHLLRLAKTFPEAQVWIREHPNASAWLVDWLMFNTAPPREEAKVFKPGRVAPEGIRKCGNADILHHCYHPLE
jgi:hypothetical protein